MSRYSRNEMLFREANKTFYRYLVLKRFLKNVTIGGPNECWEWQGGISGAYGYACFVWGDKKILHAHVASYVLFKGHRNGLHVCHSCDNPLCVNPKHLWLGTPKQNMDDMVKKGRSSGKLSIGKAKRIRRYFKKGWYTKKELAKRYGVSTCTIRDCLKRRYWNQ